MPSLIVACECSGNVRDAFGDRGWDAWSCDIKPAERGGNHIVGDARAALVERRWDVAIMHPPCTYLSAAGNRWAAQRPAERMLALLFVLALWRLAPARAALENPAGALSSLWRPPDQYVSPHYFGSMQRKRTGLWLRELAPLQATLMVPGAKLWRPNGHRNAATRAANRSRTDPAIAEAMALQWG